jgi:hypothetical protein
MQSNFATNAVGIFICALLLIPLALALYALNRQKKYNLLFGVWMVYLTYGVARAICLLRFIGKQKI